MTTLFFPSLSSPFTSTSPRSSSPLTTLFTRTRRTTHHKKPIFAATATSSLYSLDSDPSLPTSVQTFWKWLSEEGVISRDCPVRPARVPEGLGLVASRDIAQDEIILRVPRRLWINPDTVLASEIGYLCTELKPWVAVSLFLIREKMRCTSPWRFYIDLLPERTDSTLYWSEEELAEIEGTLLLRMTKEMKEHVASEYQKVEEEIISHNEQLFPPSITLDGFLWAFSMLRSRAFSHLRGQLVMLPLVDLINHSDTITREDNAEEINGPAGLFSWDLLFCLKSALPVKEGEQVFIQYGLKKSNADLALYYGFVEPNSDRDSYTLTFAISKSDPFFREKLEIAEANDLGESVCFDIFMDRSLPPAMLPFLRLMALEETDAFLLEPVLQKSVWRTLEFPISLKNEELVCIMVRDACKSALSGYPTTIEQDEELIQGGNLDWKREIAVRVRAGEKQILQQIEGIFKEREVGLDKFEYYHERMLKELGLVGKEGEIYCEPKKDSIPSM